MLRLDSYLSPFLLSYLSKYIKDIEAKNLQLSLWGGDAVLHNLQFKLDALDNELGNAPFTFVSCQAQELRIHVPWSKLQSESVVVTINTVECVLKLSCKKTRKKSPPLQDEQKESTTAQSSYIDSLLNKIKNNIVIQVNNLILKYVEDDIVLSVNMQSAVYQPVDEWWRPSYVEITETSRVLRRIFELKDVTICLDRRGASGLVESFDDPMLFRSRFVFRQHITFPSHTSRKPSATKINLMIDRYELNITENQLPPFLHLLQLCLHLYYKRIEVTIEESCDPHDEGDSGTSNKQGWASWAWSYVPPVLSYDVPENEEKNPIFAFGMYVKNIVIRFKPSRKESTRQFHTSQNSHFKPLIEMVGEGLSLEMVAQGLEFFSCVTSLANGSIKFEGGMPSKINDKTMPNFIDDSILLASAGGPLTGFAADSLFDFRSPENNNTLFEYLLSYDSFFLTSGSQHAADVFSSQYLYIATDGRREEQREETEFGDFLAEVDLTDVEEWCNVNEKSWKRFTIGGNSCHLVLNSHTLMCAEILASWANNHSLKPYPLAVPQSIGTPEILKDVQFVPTRSSTFVFKNISVNFPALCLQPDSYISKQFNRVGVVGKGSTSQLDVSHNKRNCRLPTVTVNIPLATFTVKQPMYATHYSAYLSCYLSPVPRLMRSCNAQYTVDVPLIQCFFRISDALPSSISDLPEGLKPIFTVTKVVVENHTLQGTKYWMKRATMLNSQTKALARSLTIDMSPIQLELSAHIVDSWLHLLQRDRNVSKVLDLSVLESSLNKKDECCHIYASFENLVIEMSRSFTTNSVCGALKSCDMYWLTSLNQVIPFVQCNHIYEPMHLPSCFSAAVSQPHGKNMQIPTENDLEWTEKNCWFSIYIQIPCNSLENGCVVINMHSVFINLDALMYDVLANLPSVIPSDILPFVFSASNSQQKPPDTSKDENKLLMKLKSRFALQIRSKGVQLFALQKSFPTTLLNYSAITAIQVVQEAVKQNGDSMLSISFPQITVFTSGFKPIMISPALLKSGVQINLFTEFSTLNICCEQGSIYTVHVSGKENCITRFIALPCAATATLVFKQPKESKTNIALHLDLDPIALKISKDQINLLVNLYNLIQKTVSSITRNCSVCIPETLDAPSAKERKLSFKRVNSVTESKNETSQTYGKNEEEPKSLTGTSVLQSPAPFTNNLRFTLWLQCTLPRFSLTIYSDIPLQNKAVLCIDDVSLSLDCQTVFLKLMSSFSTCDIFHWTKADEDWSKDDVMSVLLSPMFSILPSFVQKFDTPKSKAPPLAPEMPAKHRKFFDVTFTQALTSDYRRQALDNDSENKDVASSSVASTSGESFSPIKPNISELICCIQSFDLVLNPDVVSNLLLVFSPLQNLNFHHSNSAVARQTTVDIPALYLTVNGARLFLPPAEVQVDSDDLVMLCLGNLDVNSQPQNPLSRLVVSTAIYRRANAAGLLHCPGSSLEDKQFEITLQDINLGTTKSRDIVSFLKKPTLCENPALQWNINGESLMMSDPVFHPVIEQLDIQITVAPSMWHASNSNRYVLVCGPSLEVNVLTDIIMHVTTMQSTVLRELVKNWGEQQRKIQLEFQKTLKKAEGKPDDSGFSACGSSHASDKAVLPANSRLLGDCLLTGQKINVLVYQFVENDRITPLCKFEIQDPSFVFHVSKLQQKIELQFHDASINVSNIKTETVASVHELGNFSISFLETLPGECNKRTGVPSSLFTLTASHFLTKKAALKLQVGRPLKLAVQEHAVTTFQRILNDFGFFDTTSEKPKQGSDMPFHKFSSLEAESTQFVLQLEHKNHCLRLAVNEIGMTVQETNALIICNFTACDASARLCPSKKHFIPLLYPVTLSLTAKSHIYKAHPPIHYVTAKLSAVSSVVSVDALQGLSDITNIAKIWISNLPSESSKAVSDISVPIVEGETKFDDIRKSSYIYITSEDREPLPGQIIFSSKFPVSSMTWCYEKPHCVKHVSITPIPFNEILGDHSEVRCVFESFNEVRSAYEERKEFYLSETNHVDFTLFSDDTDIHEIVSSSKWRICVHNTEKCHVSPLSLAASMDVESVFDFRYCPSISGRLCVDNVKFTTMTTQDNGEVENLQTEINNLIVSLQQWFVSSPRLVLKTSFNISANALETHNLSWLPVLLPVTVDVDMLKEDTTGSMSVKLSDTTEVHITQRAIHSLQHLTSVWAQPDIPQSCPPVLALENHTNATLVFGQALTDESVSIASGQTVNYMWRTTKVEPKLHISAEGLPDWIWSAAFFPTPLNSFCCAIDDMHSVIVSVEPKNCTTTLISFKGKTRFINAFPEDIQARLMVKGKLISANCPTSTSQREDLLLALSDISTISFKFLHPDSESSTSIFSSDFVDYPKNSKFIQLKNSSGEVFHAQVRHFQRNFSDIIAVFPLFLVRSYIPDPVILHVETRCQQSSVKKRLQGRGNELLLPSLSPFETHHLTVQPNENESPFDATVPIHFSLHETLPESSALLEQPFDFSYNFPYSDPDYSEGHGETWSAGDGKIQAKLSVYSSSILIEVVPWVLVNNQTAIVLCLTSPDEAVSIIQPGQLSIPHHFIGMFNIRSVNSGSSEWMMLSVNSELNHPSRAEKLKQNHVPFNGIRNVLLQKKNSIVELCLHSSIRHGIRVITISPKWWFCNLSSHFQNLQARPCVSQQLQNLDNKDDLIVLKHNTVIPLLEWKLESETVDCEQGAENRDENEIKDISIQSTAEESTSSFLCVDPDPYEISIQSFFSDRSVFLVSSNLISLVSVKDPFDRKLVEFYSSSEKLLRHQLMLTKHENYGLFYLVLNDIKQKKYILHNTTASYFYIREVTDAVWDPLEIAIPPETSVPFESFMDSEMFPRCMRRYRSIKMQVREASSDTWTDFLVSAKLGADEVLLPDAHLLYVKIRIDHGYVHIDFLDKKDDLHTEVSNENKMSYTGKIILQELRVVFLDDMSNPLYSVDIMQACIDRVEFQLNNHEKSGKWLAKLSAQTFQLDNQLYPNSDFPVFLASTTSDFECCAFSVIFSDSFQVEEVEVLLRPLELQSESSFAHSLSRLLQSYMEAFHVRAGDQEEEICLPISVMNEVNVLVSPLRLQAIIIHPVTMLLSFRASMKVCVSVDRGAVSFSKFACRDVDTTFEEIVQELTRHYFAEAVYGAGWVIGSLDILGNPATTIRSFVKGMSDFVVMPYQGLMHGPTAFVGGFTRGFSSLLRHFSAGTLRSVTNIASGISRNLDYSSYTQSQNVQTSQLLLTSSFYDKAEAERSGANVKQGYVSGVTKALVGVVTKPIGGAAGIVSKTGESILRRVGLEEHKTVKHNSSSHPISSYANSLTKYTMKVLPEKSVLSSHTASLHCDILCSNNVKFSAVLVLSPENLHIVRLEDDVIETTISIKKISITFENEVAHGLCKLIIQTDTAMSSDKKDIYNEKVADYLGVKSSVKESSELDTNDSVKYVAQVQNPTEAQLFLSILRLIKPKSNRFEW